jgi:hypothetical protein
MQPIVINNNGPLAVTIDDKNLVQQHVANGLDPLAAKATATALSSSARAGRVKTGNR